MRDGGQERAGGGEQGVHGASIREMLRVPNLLKRRTPLREDTQSGTKDVAEVRGSAGGLHSFRQVSNSKSTESGQSNGNQGGAAQRQFSGEMRVPKWNVDHCQRECHRQDKQCGGHQHATPQQRRNQEKRRQPGVIHAQDENPRAGGEGKNGQRVHRNAASVRLGRDLSTSQTSSITSALSNGSEINDCSVTDCNRE